MADCPQGGRSAGLRACGSLNLGGLMAGANAAEAALASLLLSDYLIRPLRTPLAAHAYVLPF